MADSFGIPQVLDYLVQMGLQIVYASPEQEMIELAFHGNHGQWRLVITIQQSSQERQLVLVAPHLSTISQKKRLTCLEALMAVNYRIALGKFGLDLDDGEVRLEESIPLAEESISFNQFQLVFRSIVQTVTMYHSLIPRIVYGNLSTQQALEACEQAFFQEVGLLEADIDEEFADASKTETRSEPSQERVGLDVNDVMSEVARLLEERKEL